MLPLNAVNLRSSKHRKDVCMDSAGDANDLEEGTNLLYATIDGKERFLWNVCVLLDLDASYTERGRSSSLVN